jgi:hypothetical protein
MRNFAEWLSKFKSSISDYAYYVDFGKVYRNIDTIKDGVLPETILKKHLMLWSIFTVLPIWTMTFWSDYLYGNKKMGT